MRFFFYSLLFLILLCILSVLVVDTMTGNVANTDNCTAGNVYAFYRTLEEKDRVEYMWYKAGFVPVSREHAPPSFGGGTNFLCLRRMTQQEKDASEVRRESVVTSGGSYR